MVKAVFINLPINNLKASMAFYSAMGFKNNPQFTNDDTACMGLQRHHLCDAAQPPFMAQMATFGNLFGWNRRLFRVNMPLKRRLTPVLNTYIALLRAVNVGGTGKLPMAELSVIFGLI